jgi:hypothetical protein
VTPTAAVVAGQLLPPVPDQPATFTVGNAAAVRAVNQEGQGNTVQVTADGHFTINVLAGNVQLRVALKNALWSPDPTMAGSVWTLAAAETLALPTANDNPSLLQLLKKQAVISGTVLDEKDNPIANIPIRTWRMDAPEVATATSASNGAYSLNLVSGVWQIWAVPSDAEAYVSAESPQKVALLTPTATATQLLRVVTADVTVIGQVVDQNGLVVTPGPDGHIIPTYLDKDGIHWRQFANGAPIINGAFTLKLSSAEASHFRLHASFPNL